MNVTHIKLLEIYFFRFLSFFPESSNNNSGIIQRYHMNCMEIVKRKSMSFSIWLFPLYLLLLFCSSSIKRLLPSNVTCNLHMSHVYCNWSYGYVDNENEKNQIKFVLDHFSISTYIKRNENILNRVDSLSIYLPLSSQDTKSMKFWLDCNQRK